MEHRDIRSHAYFGNDDPVHGNFVGISPLPTVISVGKVTPPPVRAFQLYGREDSKNPDYPKSVESIVRQTPAKSQDPQTTQNLAGEIARDPAIGVKTTHSMHIFDDDRSELETPGGRMMHGTDREMWTEGTKTPNLDLPTSALGVPAFVLDGNLNSTKPIFGTISGRKISGSVATGRDTRIEPPGESETSSGTSMLNRITHGGPLREDDRNSGVFDQKSAGNSDNVQTQPSNVGGELWIDTLSLRDWLQMFLTGEVGRAAMTSNFGHVPLSRM